MLKRYGNIECIASMGADDAIKMIGECLTNAEEDRLHAQWCSLLPMMQRQEIKYVPFREYVDHCLGKDIDTRPKEDIFAEVAEIRRQMENV